MTFASKTVSSAIALTILTFAGAWANQTTPQAQPAQQQPHHPSAQAPATPGKMTMDCQSMMAAHQKMMEEMKGMDASLDTLVQKMSSATGQAKVDATAAVVAELVSQRKTMRERMESMQSRMMQHMMEHMQAGGPQAMTACPMMGMGTMKQPMKH